MCKFFQGRFEILALSISYIVSTDGSFRNRTGNLSVSLASPDGRVIGGAIGGPLIAASPVQVGFLELCFVFLPKKKLGLNNRLLGLSGYLRELYMDSSKDQEQETRRRSF